MNDDFQDFNDFVDPIIKNPLASNEGNMPHIICGMHNAAFEIVIYKITFHG